MTTFSAYSNKEIIEDLKKNIQNGTVIINNEELLAHIQQEILMQQSPEDEVPMAYIEAVDVDDIKGVLQTARKFHIPVIAQDHLTSTVIGSGSVANSFLLSTAKMDKIIEISPEDSIAVVQPGVINNILDSAARKQGMFYAPDPGSKLISGIGGNVATNAGGMSTVKYGATKDNILGLKVVLADGREIKLGGKTWKQAFGYDLTQLFVGSEGTLGIITEITVKLLPIPMQDVLMGIGFFKDMTTLAQAVNEVRLSGVSPTMLEALDQQTIKAIDKYDQTDYHDFGSTMLLFKLDQYTDESIALVEKILNKYEVKNLQMTEDSDKQEQLQKIRNDMLPAIFQGNNHLMEDMALPLSQLAAMMDFINKLSQKLDLPIYTAGHAGDGNIHPTFVWDKNQAEVPDKILTAIKLMFEETLRHGGTISGEHAVGMLKNQWNNAELGEDVDMIQHQIKSLFDPMNILNPKRKIN